MNERQQELYDNLMALIDADEAFFFSDQNLPSGALFRIFNYRLASYSQWLLPDALECRGVMFLMADDGSKPVALASWPFEKFFNLHENPFTMNLDLTGATSIQEKMDGSLISTFYFDGRVRVKSKGSLNSDQAHAAQRLLESKDCMHLYNGVDFHTMLMDHTVIMEYTAPENRIVIPTDKPTLTVLGVRDNKTGGYVDRSDWHEGLWEYEVNDMVDEVDDVNAFVESIYAMTAIEGYVVTLASGQRIKIKTDWYSALHHLKDSINSQRRLFEAIVYDTIDDVRAQFYDDAQAIALIDEMQEKVSSIYNHLVSQVETYYKENKDLDRKSFAIKGQQELDKLCFSLAMQKYTGKEIDYRETMVKHRKNFGIKDDPVKSED